MDTAKTEDLTAMESITAQKAVEDADSKDKPVVDKPVVDKPILGAEGKPGAAAEQKVKLVAEDKTVLTGEGKSVDDAEKNAVAEQPSSENNDDNEDDDDEEDDDENNDARYMYTQRDQFTSEIYKIEITNLGIFGIQDLRKLIKNRLQLDVVKIKSPNRRDSAFVCFRNEKNQMAAITALKGLKWKGRVLDAFVAKPSADPYIRKRFSDNKGNASDAMPPPKKVRTAVEATCPLGEMAYDIQINIKREKVISILEDFKIEVGKLNPDIASAVANFELSEIRKSPKVDAYRNKCEFTVGYNAKKEVVVGFRLGSYTTGNVEVDEVADLPHIPDSAKSAATSLEEFIGFTGYEPFSPVTNSGLIKQLMVRTSSTNNDMMLVVDVNNRGLSEEDEKKMQNDLRKFYLTYLSFDNYKCTSLYYNGCGGGGGGGDNKRNRLVHLLGSTHITDTILNCTFRIGPLSFFQVNTPAASVLYNTAIEMADLKPESIVLDVCCGIGTIGLCFAKHCSRVLGVEIVPNAIEDAKLNAIENGITNCKFYAGNAEHFIQSMTREVVYGHPLGKPLDLLAILDPPRAGISSRTISYLRASPIKKVVYLSCDPEKALKNFYDLCRPQSKLYKGDPFVPKIAKAVDLFPHTIHVELVVLFERDEPEKKPPTGHL